VSDYRLVLKSALPHGIIAGVELPPAAEPPSPEVIARLHPEEAEIAAGLRGHRLVAFVGGRLAARAVLGALGRKAGPVLAGPRGEPLAPEGVSLSISHKQGIAVALAARSELGDIGVDLEDLGPPRDGIAARVLRPEERAAVDALAEGRRWTATLQRFVVKEAIYKALAPRLQRFIGFEEAAVTPHTDGRAVVELHLAGEAAPVAIDARLTWLDEHLVGSVVARWS
jgi:4'-phosphopantetheinyl transferase EntD